MSFGPYAEVPEIGTLWHFRNSPIFSGSDLHPDLGITCIACLRALGTPILFIPPSLKFTRIACLRDLGVGGGPPRVGGPPPGRRPTLAGGLRGPPGTRATPSRRGTANQAGAARPLVGGPPATRSWSRATPSGRATANLPSIFQF